jgi:hypothetical protein
LQRTLSDLFGQVPRSSVSVVVHRVGPALIVSTRIGSLGISVSFIGRTQRAHHLPSPLAVTDDCRNLVLPWDGDAQAGDHSKSHLDFVPEMF